VVVRLLKNKKPKKIVPLPVKKVAFKLRAEALVKELYTLEMSSQKATEFLHFYHYPLKKYFGKTEVSKKKILQDRTNYFNEFKKRTYTNMKTSILSSDANQTIVKISFDYKIDNGKKALTGTSNHQLTVVEVNGEAKISEIALFKAAVSSKKEKKTTVPLSERAISLVKELYNKEMSSNDEEAFVSYFSYPLKNYFNKKEVSKEDILKDKKSYFKSWSSRNYTNMKVSVLSESTKEIKVKITFNYAISNGKKSLRGKSKHLVTVAVVKNKVLVSGIELYK